MNEDQPLNEPLLPTHGAGFTTTPGYSIAKKSPASGSRGPSPSNRNARPGAGRVGGRGGRIDGVQAAGNDSFVYQIVRSQRERTETTI